ncbi:PREDICTED: NADH dehydrogenase [ubiquinone] flavoprotein 3, mitochondrial isoform X1 [Crocodylus porosus]|uniref:NADH dehydrogenase [ubiquinone] flavoprotein 3, mitochondrial isoform X1 n=1 Tax=Crocodylus porosus TaxID=8502 RepID=UPI00093AE97D|nr:PREDICTED: NADH dehydrogenase [ubiquinone] flavoprotein 3, mitochondrial isoform X1 [Crocodylus porosus]
MAPQESTNLLTTKTTVEFPKKLSPSSHPPPANTGMTIASPYPDEALKLADEDTRKCMSRKTLAVFPQKETLSSREGKGTITTARGLNKKLAKEKSSSSSSSDSDSSSDSEEDSTTDVALKTKVAFPRLDPHSFENGKVKKTTLVKQRLSQKSDEEYASTNKSLMSKIELPHIKQIQSAKTSTTNDGIKSKPRVSTIKQISKKVDKLKLISDMPDKKSQKLTEVSLKNTNLLKESATEAQAAATQLKDVPVTKDTKPKLTLSGEESKTKMQEPETQEIAASKLHKELLKTTAMAVDSTAKKETTQEAGTQTEMNGTIQEIKTAAASAPEEFDNSTYKNLQHHEYHMYTFVDFDVYLSKFRQPQPSSGRISPWQ